MLTDLGMHSQSLERNLYLSKKMDVSATAHQAGTVRLGADPQTSALDVNRRAHEIDNLYVIDGSFMPSSVAVNPTLTIIANVLRVSAHNTRRLARF
jgi:choline dehydrogenase-like flavoprotein